MTEDPLGSVATAADDGKRADVVLAAHVPGLSRRAARRLGLGGHLRIDGQRALPSQRVRAGQRLSLSPPARPGPIDPPRVLACTDAFVYVDKPPGLHTVARWPGDLACLAAAVARAHPECGSASPDPREAGAIHRLDRETSGVVAFARSRAAWNDARDALRSGEVGRRYVAACPAPEDLLWPPALPRRALPAWLGPGPSASPPLPLPPLQPAPELSLRVRAPLGHGPDRGRVAVRLDGQPAATLVQPRGLCAAGLLCELELETGHRHQARVHLAWLGLPIRGDVRYGGIPAARLHLHAARLDLSRVLATEVAVEAPIDPAFLA